MVVVVWTVSNGCFGHPESHQPRSDTSPQDSPSLSPTSGAGQPQVSMQHRCGGRHAACTYPLLQHQAMGGQKRREILCKWGKCC